MKHDLTHIRYRARIAHATGDLVRKELAEYVLDLCDHIDGGERPAPVRSPMPGVQMCAVLGDQPATHRLTLKTPDGETYTQLVCEEIARNAESQDRNIKALQKVFKVTRLISCERLPEQHRANDADPVYDHRFEGCLSV